MYKPVLDSEDGILTDILIEETLALIYSDSYPSTMDRAFTGIMREYIHPDTPHMNVSKILNDPLKSRCDAVGYFCMFKMDFNVICKDSRQWVDFDAQCPDAKYAVTIHYPNEEDVTHWSPGVTLNQAILASLLQLAREVAESRYNQEKFNLT